MTKTLKLALLLCSSLFIAVASSAQQSRKPAPATGRLAGVEKSYAKARQALDAAIAAHGGMEAMRAVQDVTVKVSGTTYARNQSVRVEPPFDAEPRDETLFVDLRNRTYVFENRDPLPGGFVFGGKTVIVGNQGFFVDPRNRTVQPINLTNFNNINYVRRVPHLLLMTALDRAGTLRWLGTENYKGRPHNVVTFATNVGNQITLYFDAGTNLLTKYEQMVSDFVDGDTAQEVIFSGYRTIGKLKVPAARMTTRAGGVIEDVKYVDVQFDTRPPQSAFAKPEGFTELPMQTPSAIKETKLADGVYLFESANNTLVVEFKDYVLVVEPTVGSRGPQPTITKIKEMMPGKPVKYVVPTHHHDDHSGGVRTFVAEGTIIVTTPGNQRYFEQMARAPFTITSDRQTREPRQPIFEIISDKKRVFTDGEQIVEIIDIGPSPHAAEMLLAYLPKHKLVFQGDLIILPPDGKFVSDTVNDTTLHFAEAIRRLGLDVERIAAVHGPTTTLDALKEAIAAKQRPAK
ncbi:MAG: MBL fold metallo-hydrolase [Acidobacteriota bacterium]|nr:MBL fold metallo-hydrolase [Acidobacteriota bacterium]